MLRQPDPGGADSARAPGPGNAPGCDNGTVTASARRPLADDTPLDIEAVQVELWRRMTPAAKAGLVAGLCQGVREAALEGIRRRHPADGPREQFLRLAILYLGRELALEAFPEAADLAQ